MLPEVLKSAFCGCYTGKASDLSSDAGAVWSTVQRVLRRAEDHLATLEASFEPIKDKAVPERIPMRQKIDEYTAAVRDLRAALASW